MSYDLYTSFPCATVSDVEAIVDNNDLDIATRIQLLAPALATWAKDSARTGGDKRTGGGYKSLVFADGGKQPRYAKELIDEERKRMEQLGLWQPGLPDLTHFPRYAFFIQFSFTLASPYISRDDDLFHINDNPVRKDRVFNVPYVAASGWKGALRAAMTELQTEDWQEQKNMQTEDWQEQKNMQTLAARRFRLTRLFGDEKGEEGEQVKELAAYLDDLSEAAAQVCRQQVRACFHGEEMSLPHHAGSIQFFPTFFDSIGLEVINPHDRKTGAGKLPIYFECVPAKTTGTFSLLYVPINVPAKGSDVADDLKLLAEGIVAMLTLYGFGAKTSSGYGRAEDALSTPGEIILHAHLPALSVAKPKQIVQPKSAQAPSNYQEPSGQLIADLRKDDGSMKSEAEYQDFIVQQGRAYKKRDKQLYEKAAKWWEREGRGLWQQQLTEPEPAHQPEPEPEPEPERPVTTTCSFQSLGELLEKADTIAAALKEGGDE